MAVRVRNFLRANPFGEAKADAVVTRFAERVDRAQALLAQQENGRVLARAARSKRSEIKRQLTHEALRQLIEIGRAASIDQPELADWFRPFESKTSLQRFRALAQGFLERAQTQKDLLLEHGMRATLLEELGAALAQFDGSVSDADAARRSHTGARAELAGLASTLIKMVHQLNGMMVFRIREQPELGGAWNSARNIAWPLSHPSIPPTDGTGGTEGGNQSAA
jgi:hypothetical protein